MEGEGGERRGRENQVVSVKLCAVLTVLYDSQNACTGFGGGNLRE